MAVQAYCGKPVTRGDQLQIAATLNTDGSATCICGATITMTISYRGKKLTSDVSGSIQCAAAGTVNFCLTEAQTGAWPFHRDPLKSLIFEGDVKAVLSGCVTRHFGPFTLKSRRAIT